jgi:hypothetical protein
MRGIVINIHLSGALVRLEDGSLATVTSAELAAHRPAYTGSHARRTPLDFVVNDSGRHRVVTLEAAAPAVPAAPLLVDHGFEERIGAYLKETEAWAPPDRPAPAERHFIRKKRRAAFFEARNKPT